MGALVAVMSWVYISTFILLAGAHFAAQLHRRDHGRPDRLRRRVQPEPPRRSGSLRVFTGR
jgi:uncharacterized BrkB/YihY/UPF0761 family membrane protein